MFLVTRLVPFADQFADWLNRRQRSLLIAFTICYFAATGVLAGFKLLWFDELFTMHLSRLPSLADLWAALAMATDLNPPLSYVIERTSQTVFGQNPWALRLPSMVGFWVMSLSLYWFLKQRCGAVWAWIGLLVPLATWAYPYAFEARPYGIILGCCGGALVCWQNAAEGQRRALCLLGLTLSLAVAVASHYFAVLLFIPIGIGEVVRTYNRRRVDLLLWLALVTGLCPLAWCLPLIQLARNYSATHHEQAGLGFLHEFYYQLLGRMTLPLLILLFALALYPRRGMGSPDTSVATTTPSGTAQTLPAHELAAALALLALPVFGVLLARVGSGNFGLRYALSAVVGFGLVLPFVLHRLSGGSTVFGAGFLTVLVAWCAAVPVGEFQRINAERGKRLDAIARLGQQGDGNTPVAVTGPITYLQTLYYASPALRARLVYVIAPDVEQAYFTRRHYSIEGALVALARWRELNLVDYQTFIEEQPRFLVSGLGKLTTALEADGVRFEVVSHSGSDCCVRGERMTRVTQVAEPQPTSRAD